MKKLFAIFFLCATAICALPGQSYAQTTVTGTVTDPNGNAYAFGTASAYSLTSSGQPSVSTTPVLTNSAGSFSMPLAANTYIFTICAPPVQLGPLANPTPQQVCFSSQPIAISGSSIDISSLLNATAAVLGPKQKLPFLPGYSTAQYGTTGNGSTEDSLTFQAAINACPQISPIIGCDIYVPAGLYKWSSTVAVGLLKGIHLHGSGSVGTGGCGTIIQTYGAGTGLTVGSGTSPDSSGFLIENICFQDMTANGAAAIDFQAMRDVGINNVVCFNYYSGTCVLADGVVNFTQFSLIQNLSTWHSKYRWLTNHKTASFHIIGGEGNCQNSTSTDVIPGSSDIDLGWTNGVAGTGTASEYVISTQTQNCQFGRSLWNAGGNRFSGDKALENSILKRANGTVGVRVGGDTASLANGNVFDAEQINGAAVGWYFPGSSTLCGGAAIACVSANTTIIGWIPNGTNGTDAWIDAAISPSVLTINSKQWFGWTTNVGTLVRDPTGSTVTLTTVASGDTGLICTPNGTLFQVTMGTGSADFNGTFPATVSCNDSTGVTTATWSQSGTANESATVTSGFCTNPATSCVTPMPTLSSSGVGVQVYSGNHFTEDIVLEEPTIPNVGNIVTTSPSNAARIVFDGARTDIIENNNGVVHLSGGGVTTFNGNASQSYTPQPTVVTGGNGTVNTSGTAVTWESGTFFALSWAGQITINNVVYTIATTNSSTSITLTSSAGTQTGVNFAASGLVGVPPCTSPSGGYCQSSDDKKLIVFNNTNGSTLCLPPIGTAAYPTFFSFDVEFEPGNPVANYTSITPPGSSSYYSQACLGTAVLFRGSSSYLNLVYNSGLHIANNGTNWEATSGAGTVPIDQVVNAITNDPIPLNAGNYTGAGSGANNGADWSETAGNSNSSGGRGGDKRMICGSDSASGKNGDCGIDQTLNAGIGLASKTGFIVRPCKDVTGTDCVNTVPSGNSGAVRLMVSGTDAAGAVGIVVSGAGAGAPAQVRISGVYGHDFTDGAVVETNCPSGQINYYASGSTNSLDNGAGECDTTDSGRRIGYALTAATGGIGTVNTSGTAVTWVSGTQFNTSWTGTVTINAVSYTISSVASATSMTLTSTAGTQNGVAYSASGVCSHTTPCKVPVLIAQATQSVAVEASTITTLGSPVNVSGVTAVLTKAVTMPSSGCPCRAFVGYGYYANAGAHGLIQAFVSDGTNPMATSELNISIDGNSDGGEGSSFSPTTYANGASVTFTLDVNNSSAGTVVVAATNGGSVGQNTWLNVAILPSN